MKNTKPTKGITYFKASGEDFEDIFTYPNDVDTHSLIAAAPELLEALEFALADIKRCEAHFAKTRDFGVSALALGLAEQAISKAKGD